MTNVTTRRSFLATAAAGAAGTLLAPRAALASTAIDGPRSAPRNTDIAVGITVDTRPDWNGGDNFIRSIDEASSIGYKMIETFWSYVARWENDQQALKDELDRRDLGIVTVSNGGPGMRTNFTDPAEREGVIEDHMKLVDFIQWFGCQHLKINLGGDQPEAAELPAETYREMAITLNEIGRRMTDLGMKFGVHAHLNSPFETRQDIDAIMELTDPEHVHMILDTGHITMAGMDPVQLTRDYLSRIIEYHVKDVAASDRGGTTRVMGRRAGRSRGGLSELMESEYPGVSLSTSEIPAPIRYRDRHFFELGTGGVDFPAIHRILTDAGWTGWFTVELDSTVTTSQGSATVSKEYLERILGLDPTQPGQRPNWTA